MQKQVVEAYSGSVSASESFQRLGISVASLSSLSPEAHFKLIADRLSPIEDPTLKAAMAMEVFGKSGTRLLPLIAIVPDAALSGTGAALGAIASGVTGIGAAIASGVTGIGAAIASGVTGIGAAIATLGSIIASILSPIGLVNAGVVTLTDYSFDQR